MTYEPTVYALIRAASEGPSEAALARAPEALVRFCGTARQLADLYPWGERRHLRPRMVRALVRQLLAAGQLAGDDPAALPDWSWLWDPRVASGPGTPPAFDPATDPRTGEEPEPSAPKDEDEGEQEAVEEEEVPGSETKGSRTRDQIRSARPPGPPSQTEDPRRYTQERRREIRREAATHPGGRPQTRAECPTVRPCPWISCRHNLYLDVLPNGSIQLNFPDLEPGEMRESCSLDIADQGEHSLAAVGAAMNVTRERIRQLELSSIRHLERYAPAFVEHTDGHEPQPRRVLPVLPPSSRTPPPATPENPTSFEGPKPEAPPPRPVAVEPVVTRKVLALEEAPPPAPEPELPPPPVPVEEEAPVSVPAPAPVPPSEWPPEALTWLARGAQTRRLLEAEIERCRDKVTEAQAKVREAEAKLQEHLDLLEDLKTVLAEASDDLAAGKPFDRDTSLGPPPPAIPLRQRILASLESDPATAADLARRLDADRYQVHARLREAIEARQVVQLEDGRFCLLHLAPAPQPTGWAPGTVSASAPLRERILAELRQNDFTVAALAARLGVPYRRLYAPLRGLAASGDAVQLDDGRWGLMMRQTG